MARIFLSHALSDSNLARCIEKALKDLNHSFDLPVDKPPAGRWRERILRAIGTADVIIPILSEKGLQSNYVASEIGSGRILDQTRNTLLLPVVVATQFHVPSFVSDYHCFRLLLDAEGELSESDVTVLGKQIDNAITEHLDARSPRVFISHRHKDQDVVKALVSLIEDSFVIRASDIRCTSVHPYKLAPGDRTSEKLRAEIRAAEVVLGIISPEAQDSKYVLAELGAAWGCEIPTFPILIRGATYADVPSPLDELSCLDISVAASCTQCVEAISRVSSLERIAEQGALPRIQESTNELARVARMAI